MRPRPSPPFLEFQGYFGETLSLVGFVEGLVERGAVLGNSALAHPRGDSEFKRAASVTAVEQLQLPVSSLDDLLGYERSGTVDIVQVELSNALKLDNGPELATIVGIPEDLAGRCSNPLALWTSGRARYLPIPYSGTTVTARNRRRLVDALWMIADFQPLYAALTESEPLPCPGVLRRDRRTHAFQDFFLSRELLPKDWRSKSERLGATVIESQQGALTLSWTTLTGKASLSEAASAALADAAIDAILASEVDLD